MLVIPFARSSLATAQAGALTPATHTFRPGLPLQPLINAFTGQTTLHYFFSEKIIVTPHAAS